MSQEEAPNSQDPIKTSKSQQKINQCCQKSGKQSKAHKDHTNFNTSLSVMDRTSRQEIDKKREDLYNTINLPDITDTHATQ
jgi:hypothetical protein